MSRFRTWSADNRYEVAWGYDHAVGLFIQVFDCEAKDPDQPIVDLDELFDDLTWEQMLAIGEKYEVKQDIEESM